MKRNLRVLYNRIKGYDIESLRVDLLCQLELKKPPDDKYFFYNHTLDSKRQNILNIIKYIQRKKQKE